MNGSKESNGCPNGSSGLFGRIWGLVHDDLEGYRPDNDEKIAVLRWTLRDE